VEEHSAAAQQTSLSRLRRWNDRRRRAFGRRLTFRLCRRRNGSWGKVQPDQGKVIITHEPIAPLEMPTMTMVFRAQQPKVLQRFQAGRQGPISGGVEQRPAVLNTHRAAEVGLACSREPQACVEPSAALAGNRRVNVVVPATVSLLALTRPPCACMMERTIASPSPAPPLNRAREASRR
jgi:hypothetical protein